MSPLLVDHLAPMFFYIHMTISLRKYKQSTIAPSISIRLSYDHLYSIFVLLHYPHMLSLFINIHRKLGYDQYGNV